MYQLLTEASGLGKKQVTTAHENYRRTIAFKMSLCTADKASLKRTDPFKTPKEIAEAKTKS